MLRSLATLVGKGPPHPPKGIDPRGVSAGALGGPKKCRLRTPLRCKAQGGGGAPPTNLILLRNQWSRALPVAQDAASQPRGTPAPACRHLAGRLSRPANLAGRLGKPTGSSPSPPAPPAPRGASLQDPLASLARPSSRPPGARTCPPPGPLTARPQHAHSTPRVASLRVGDPASAGLAVSPPERNPGVSGRRPRCVVCPLPAECRLVRGVLLRGLLGTQA